MTDSAWCAPAAAAGERPAGAPAEAAAPRAVEPSTDDDNLANRVRAHRDAEALAPQVLVLK